MLYIFVFVILNSFICIYSKSDFVDRLDLFLINSYLIIKCNEHEIQIIRSFNTYEEFESNFECTNKNDLLQHENDKVQLVNCGQSTITCVKKKYLQMTGHFTRVKSSVKKDKKGVDWPIIHTKYTKEIKKSDPITMNFIKKDHIDIIFDEIQVNQLKHEKNNLTIYFDFVNRPMICSNLFQGIQVKEKDGTCNPFHFDSVKSSMCYYEVGAQKTPSHTELDEIIEKTFPYVVKKKDIYIYISPDTINSSNDSIQQIDFHLNNITQQISTKYKEEKKKKSFLRFLLIIFSIVFIIGLIIFYGIYSKQNKNLLNKDSDTSNESQISISSSKIKQETKRRTNNHWFKLDEDI